MIIIACLALALILGSTPTSSTNAYQLSGPKWRQPSTTFYVNMPATDNVWNNAFEQAMYIWGNKTIFTFYIVPETYEDPCDPTDYRNGVGWGDTFCGDTWGSTTVAVTQTWQTWQDDYYFTQTDIVFNSNLSWNVYSTPWSSGAWHGINDFQRVAVHELGHTLGLTHEDSGISSIMQSNASDITEPQPDDIAGVLALYGDYTSALDSDNDGILDDDDNCPGVYNTFQTDNDGDNIGNECDICPNDAKNDADADGICADLDNCPNDANQSQLDTDNDGTGDTCDSCPEDGTITSTDSPCPAPITFLSQTQVSQLYVAIFGRASEGDGNEYWQKDPIGVGITTTANIMLSTGAATTYFGSTLSNNQDFIEHIYLNTLGKSYQEDQQGIDYWVAELDGGKSKGEVVSALISAATSASTVGFAQDRFNNKVSVSNYAANKINQFVDFNTFSMFIINITSDQSTVTSSKLLVDSVANSLQ